MTIPNCIADHIADLQPSGTVEISDKIQEQRRQGKEVLSLSIGEPEFSTPDPILDRMHEALKQHQTKYISSAGLPDLRAKICEKLKEENNLSYDPDQILVACGAKHGIYQVLQTLVNPEEDVLIPAPYWVSYPEMVNSVAGNPAFINPEDGTSKITVDDLQKYTTSQTKVLILNSPNNPSGAVYSPERIKRIMKWAKNQDVYVISDEIYEYFTYDDHEHLSPASLGEDAYNRTLTINGFSKAFSMTGLRVGYVAGPESIMNRLQVLQSHTTTHTASISQYGALAALDLPESFRAKTVDRFRKRRDIVLEYLDDIPHISYTPPEGAFYVYIDVAEYLQKLREQQGVQYSDSDLCEKLLEDTGVAVIPGSAFGTENRIRISYTPGEDTLREGMNRLKSFMSSLIS